VAQSESDLERYQAVQGFFPGPVKLQRSSHVESVKSLEMASSAFDFTGFS